jgi:hypothetical protein
MLLRDTEGGFFEAHDIEALSERYDDSQMGEVARVRLSDGSHRIVRVVELDLAAMSDTVGSLFLASWPTWPGSS